ncbi:hypothetical protein Tco_0924350 [Tanacetum coccineum]|uniref:Retrovirus-related Pol polyprotein from transposon TNT 1-94-like beta-barrel domain-containing protein n=1 Tax=Tanacetum coccineum TaxID=301880 RepID=A0ABQ5D6R8_9ASTR
MQSNETNELNMANGDKGESSKELVSTVLPKIVSTARPKLSTARPDVDAARQEDSAVEPRTPPTTTSIFDDEDITMAQTLIKMKEEKAKEKGVSIKDIEDSSRLARSILTLKPLLKIDPKDKGKSVLKEPEPAKKMTRSDFDAAQIARDAEIARQLQVDLQAEVERERQREEEASKAAIAETYDEVQAGIDADALFAAKLQQEEREEYTIEERAKFLAETIAAQRKFRAAQRSAEIRSRPPTKSQLRNLMMTYLKNMGGYKHSQLKAKTFAEIQGLYERKKRVINDFKPMDSDDAVKDSKEADGVHKQKVLEEPNITKVEIKQEGHEEKEDQLKGFLKIVPDEEGIIDYEVLEKRFPIINWESKFYDFDRHGAECIYYKIFRSDGSSRWIKTFSKMVTRFDRLDLEELYNLMMKRFETTTPEGVDLVLWGDLRIMFDANAEDELWQNQERWNLKSLQRGTGTASEDAYTLLRFIPKQIDEYDSHNGGEKDLEVKELASPKQTALGKDISNPLIVDSLLKTIWLSMHHVIAMKHWLFQSKRLLLLLPVLLSVADEECYRFKKIDLDPSRLATTLNRLERFIQIGINTLFDEVLENIESKDSYEPALLVTPLSDFNEDECFDPEDEIKEIDTFLDMDISTDIENGYHDSEGDIIYLESLLINETIPNLPPGVFLDHDPKNLNDEPNNEDLKTFYGARPSNNNRRSNNNNRGNHNNSCGNNKRGHDNGRQFDWASTQNTVYGTCPYRNPSTIRTRPTANFANTRAQSLNAFANWHSDTRANSHVTPDLEAMDNSEAYYGDDALHVGNGKGLPILHIGSSKVYSPQKTFFLKNILRVPEISHNLLSIQNFCHDNCNTPKKSQQRSGIPLLGCYFIVHTHKLQKTTLKGTF